MPSKSRRHRGKQPVQSKRKKGRPSRPTTPLQPPVEARVEKPVASPEVKVPSVITPAPVTRPAVISYPYVTAELRTIGILAGVMLIVLIVLALVWS